MKVHIPIAGVKRKVLIGAVVALPIIGGGGAAYAATLHGGPHAPAPAVTAPLTNATPGTDTPGPNDAPDSSEAGPGAETSDTNSSVTDGTGGHQDPNGVDVNHQFDGQE